MLCRYTDKKLVTDANLNMLKQDSFTKTSTWLDVFSAI